MKKYTFLVLLAVSLLLVNVAFAIGDDLQERCWSMMGGNNSGSWPAGYGMMNWSGMGFGGILAMIFAIALWVVFWAVTIVAIVALIRWLYMRLFKGELWILSKKEISKESAEDILKMRYAKGEIGKEEYEEMKKELAK